MKVALVHDELVRMGGAEQVLLSFAKAFPDAPIYTLAYNPDKVYDEFKQTRVISSWFGKFIKSDKNLKRFFFPFGIWAMRSLHIEGYDIILQSTTHCSKYIPKKKNTIIITYCHTPFRLVWRPDSYSSVAKAGKFKRVLYNLVIGWLKAEEISSAKKTDWFITNSREVVPRIVAAYKPSHEVAIINPPVNTKYFHISETKKDHYLVVSRFEPYKKVDMVIEAFNKMPDKKLVIVGKGSMEGMLKGMAGENIIFKSGLNVEELADEYASCQALIFPQHEDYGITPLEANASGRPVIGYGEGGILDTEIPYDGDASKATSVFFKEQTPEALIEAVNKFETLTFDPAFIRKHAEGYDTDVFVKKLRAFVQEKHELQNHPELAEYVDY